MLFVGKYEPILTKSADGKLTTMLYESENLPDEYFSDTALISENLAGAIEDSEEGVFMPEISGPTIPLPLLPRLGYTLVPKGKNWSYGVAALIFAAIEYKKLCEEK